MMHPRSAAALIALTACSDPSEPPPDATGTVRTISAREALTLRAGDGATKDFPVDLDAAVVHAYVRDDAGAWTVHAGEGTSGGELLVEGAPAGPAWLRIDYFDASPEAQPRNEYFYIDATDADVALDLGTWRAGRSGMRYAASVPTELAFKLSGLAPWQRGLDLAIISAPAIGFTQVFSEDGEGISGVPTEGQTGSTLAADWAGAVGGPLLDASRGDQAYALQFRFHEVGGMFVGAPVRAAALPAFTQQDGIALEIDAALVEPAPMLRTHIAMDRAAFDRHRADIGVVVSDAVGRGFAISAAASDVSSGFSMQSPPSELVVVEGEGINGTGRLDLGALDVASPYPASTVFGFFASGYRVRVERDDGLVAQALAEVGVITNVLPTATAPAAPIIGPVRNVTINGVAASAAPTGVGMTPELRWDAPELGTPVEYEVKILAPGGADPTYDFVWYPAAVFHVPGDQTSLVLPPETLIADYPYAIAIRAITHALPAADAARAPRHIALPYGWADTITPAFKP